MCINLNLKRVLNKQSVKVAVSALTNTLLLAKSANNYNFSFLNGLSVMMQLVCPGCMIRTTVMVYYNGTRDKLNLRQ